MTYQESGRQFLDKLSNAISQAQNAQSLGYSFKRQKEYILELYDWVKEQDWWDSLPDYMLEEYDELVDKANLILGL